MIRSKLLQRVLAEQFVGLPLDEYPDAAGAFSLRYVSSSFSSDVILVRRSSDDSEQGFTPEEITDGTLESFCGAGDGFVKTWYDQSGNSRDITQTTTSRQPEIVGSGTLITENSKPALDFDGTGDNLGNTSLKDMLLSDALFTVVCTPTRVNTGSPLIVWEGTDDVILYPNDDAAGSGGLRFFWRDYGGNIISEAGSDLTNLQSLYISSVASSELVVERNGTNIDTVALSGTPGPFSSFSIGIFASTFFQGYVQQFIVYNSDESSNIAGLRNTINSHYGIF